MADFDDNNNELEEPATAPVDDGNGFSQKAIQTTVKRALSTRLVQIVGTAVAGYIGAMVGWLAARFGPKIAKTIAIVVGIIILIVLLLLALAIAGIINYSPFSGTSENEPVTAQDIGTSVPLLGALSGSEESLQKFLESEPNIKNTIANLENALKNKDKLPSKDKVVPIFEQLILRLKVLADPNTTKAQKKEAFTNIVALRDKLRQISPYSYDPVALKNTRKVTFYKPNDAKGIFGNGIIIRKDSAPIVVDSRVPRLLQFLAVSNDFSLGVSSVVGGHSQLVKGKSIESRHWTGHAMDISVINNKAVSASHETACQFMKSVQENLSQLKSLSINPRQVIGPNRCADQNLAINRGVPANIKVGGHENHVHIGF